MAKKTLGTYGAGAFTKIHDELLNSNAFIALSSSAQLILIDFLSHFGRATAFDTTPPLKRRYVTPDGSAFLTQSIPYTFGDCRLPISRTVFYLALKELRRHGFLRQKIIPNGSSGHWGPSTRWKNFPDCGLTESHEKRIAIVRKRRRQHLLDQETEQLRLAFPPGGLRTSQTVSESDTVFL